ncbi:FHA domain-containing protein [Thermodesulfobacteriota bacterium]
MSKIYLLNGPLRGRSFDLKGEAMLLGRSSESDIQIRDHSVSRKHARILNKGDKLFIEDLGSQNGTWIEGIPVEQGEALELHEGILVSIGNILFSLGKSYAQDGMVAQYSIDLSKQSDERKKELLKDRRVADTESLDLINDVSQTLMETLDIHEICEKIMDALFQCLKRIDSGTVLLRNEDTGELKEIVTKSREHKGSVDQIYSRSIVDRVMVDSKAMMMSDTSLADDQDLSESIHQLQIKSIMCVPLICRGESRGVIYVHSVKQPHGFRKDDLYLITALSSPASLAIENALLYTQARDAENVINKARNDLEQRVEERTAELSKSNELLKDEIAERKRAEEELKKVHDDLTEANKNVGLAYSQMRDWKDRLSKRLYGEEIGFLLDEDARIQGVTEKAVETFDYTRSELMGKTFVDLVEENLREGLAQTIRESGIGIFTHTLVAIPDNTDQPQTYDTRLMPISMGQGKMLLALMRKSDPED